MHDLQTQQLMKQPPNKGIQKQMQEQKFPVMHSVDFIP